MAVVQTFNVKGTDYNVHDTKAVYFTNDQSLTEAQKTQAATNIGIKNIEFTIPVNYVSGSSITANGVKSDYACTPWLNVKFTGSSATDNAYLESFQDMGAMYIVTGNGSITITYTGDSPTVALPCILTCWG